MLRWVSISPDGRCEKATTFSLKSIRFSKLGFGLGPYLPVQSLSFVQSRNFFCPLLECAEQHLGCVLWPSDAGMWLPGHVTMQ